MKHYFELRSACLAALLLLIFGLSSYVTCRAEEQIPDIVESTKRSIVLVEGFTQEGDVVSGTGFIITERGDVITNYHVIKCCIFATAELSNGEMWEVMGIVAKDEKADLVRLALANVGPTFNPLILCDTVKLGERVFVIGNPSDKRWLVSSGIVSAVKVYFPDIDEHVFHHTALVDSGSSGSPVINAQGEVSGVHVGILRPTDFAIPYAIPAPKIKDLQLHVLVTLAEELAAKDTLCPKLAKMSVFRPEVEPPNRLSQVPMQLPGIPSTFSALSKMQLDTSFKKLVLPPDIPVLHGEQLPRLTLPDVQLPRIPAYIDPSLYKVPTHLEWLQPPIKKRNWFFLEVLTTLPKPTIGGKFFWVTEEDARFYIGVKGTWNRSPKTNDLPDNVSFNEAEDVFQDKLVAKKEGWTSVDLGLTGLANRFMAIYAGIGFKWFWNAKQYYDESQTLGNQGYYWIREDGDKQYLNAGLLFMIAQKICLDIGFDTKPFRFNLGAGFSLGSIF